MVTSSLTARRVKIGSRSRCKGSKSKLKDKLATALSHNKTLPDSRSLRSSFRLRFLSCHFLRLALPGWIEEPVNHLPRICTSNLERVSRRLYQETILECCSIRRILIIFWKKIRSWKPKKRKITSKGSSTKQSSSTLSTRSQLHTGSISKTRVSRKARPSTCLAWKSRSPWVCSKSRVCTIKVNRKDQFHPRLFSIQIHLSSFLIKNKWFLKGPSISRASTKKMEAANPRRSKTTSSTIHKSTARTKGSTPRVWETSRLKKKFRNLGNLISQSNWPRQWSWGKLARWHTKWARLPRTLSKKQEKKNYSSSDLRSMT